MERNRFIQVWLLVITTLLLGCGNSAIMANNTNGFRPVNIPSVITNMDSRREYLAVHYWDNFDFEDASLVKNDSVMRFAVGGYVQVLMMNPPSTVVKSLDVTLSSALKSGYDQFEQVTSKLEDWLYNPNSPMRNEELYIYVLRHTVERAQIDDIYKLRSRKQLTMALKNRRGDMATDFTSQDGGGKSHTLRQIKTPYTILFFNTPDCDDCTRVKNYIGDSTLLTEMVRANKLTIFAIYTEHNMELWRKAKYPSTILNTADTQGEISKNRLYDLKALPTLYLLDSYKRVILKDCTIEEAERHIVADIKKSNNI